MTDTRRVTLVSHGPNCLDGLTCAVVAARYFAGRRFEPVFASNREIDEVIRAYDPTHPHDEELWITDISWKDRATDLHLNSLVERGLKLFWVDHHKSAMDRRAQGELVVSFSDFVLEDTYSAARLLYEFLCKRATAEGRSKPGLLALENLVLLADDVDRWILKIDGSRKLALAVRAMEQHEAYCALLSMSSDIKYPPELEQASARVELELQRTFELAERTRKTTRVQDTEVSVVTAECDGYAGEVADRWGADCRNTVFALYDLRSDGISLRRSPDSYVDLSRLASAFGGGGHPAASGCQISTDSADRATGIGRAIAEELIREIGP